MALQSVLFAGDKDLEAAAAVDSAHIVPGARGPHVVKIQQALIDVAGATIKADGIYGPGTAAAVADFKRQQTPPILNFEGKIDDIVGIKTMAALDARLPKARGGLAFAFDAITFVDIVVNFRGAPGASFEKPEDALPREKLGSLYEPVKDSRNRQLLRRKSDGNLLLRVGHTTNAFGAEAVPILARVVFAIKAFLAEKDPENPDKPMLPDKIFVLGTSSGGRNALAFVRFLAQTGLRTHFVAPIDASFFQSDTKDRPKSTRDPADTVPTFKLNDIVSFAGLFGLIPNRHNFFQRRGNHVKRIFNPISKDFLGLEFTSKMDGGLEEIHGDIEGFKREEVFVEGLFGSTDEKFHEECDAEGRFQAQRLIVKELTRV